MYNQFIIVRGKSVREPIPPKSISLLENEFKGFSHVMVSLIFGLKKDNANVEK